jgi:hypothetical protein
MSLTLNLGVVDIPYTVSVTADPNSESRPPPTTGDVAGYLENKYHIMELFYEDMEPEITEQLADSLAGALESVLMGAPSDNLDAFAAGTSQIDAAFRYFLSRHVIESLGVPGVPTAAALAGVNHRLKDKSGTPRPSFIDTGLYQNSFRAWVV